MLTGNHHRLYRHADTHIHQWPATRPLEDSLTGISRALQAKRTTSTCCAITGQHLLHGSFCQLHGRRCSQAWLHAVLCTCMHASNYCTCHRQSRCKHSSLQRSHCKTSACLLKLHILSRLILASRTIHTLGSGGGVGRRMGPAGRLERLRAGSSGCASRQREPGLPARHGRPCPAGQ